MTEVVCGMHSVLEEQILQISKEIHDLKMAMIRLMAIGLSTVTGVVSLGVWC